MSSVTKAINSKDFDAASLHEKDNDAAKGDAFTDILNETTTDVLRKEIQEIRKDVSEFNNRINDMLYEVLQKIEEPSAKKGKFLYSTDNYSDKRKFSKKSTALDKEFLERNSLLTDLYEIPHIRTVYNLFMVTFILLLLNTVAIDIMESGTIRVGTDTIRFCFAKFPTCVYIWSFMQASTLGVYVAFILWAHQRLQFLPKCNDLFNSASIRKFWDYGWLSALILYQILFFIFPIKAMLEANLSIACRLIVTAEQARMIMKSHSFVRSVAPRYLSYKPHSETPRPSGPRFSQYLYFLFAPTLIYRDEYPRTKGIRWMVVIRNFTEFGISIFYLALIMERLVTPVYHVFGTQSLERKWFVKNIIEASIPGVLYCVTMHYLLMHAWLNAWAEMLQFADRLFYKDWWNSTNYHTYHRTWNVVVQDWLFTYIYKDMYEIVVPRNRVLSTIAVFLTSAVVHEYIFALAFGFFYPVMFVLFVGLGHVFFFVRKIFTGNVFMWFSLSTGNGIVMCLYAIEYHARYNCPPHSNYYLDLLIPRSWSCQEKFNM